MTALCYFASALSILISLPAWGLLALTLFPARQHLPVYSSPRKDRTPDSAKNLRIAVLVPAHNESIHVLPTIQCLLKQLKSSDRLLVIADNCTDDTAFLATQAGATVLVRNNTDLRGKGYALAFGVDALRGDPPDVVVVVDADCTVSEDAIAQVCLRSIETGCPVQMLNLMHAPEGAGLPTRISEFAWLVKNYVRPLGTFRIGSACHLMGTGMAIPWPLMSTAKLATGHVAEDMKLGIDMALAGHATQFFEGAQTISKFPTDPIVARAQKSRWEHGHLRTITQELPRLVIEALRTGRASLWVLALDLLLPPLALYALTLGVMVAVGVFTVMWDSMWQPFAVIVLSAAGALALAIGVSWWRHARQLLTFSELVRSPLYALWKLPIYIAYAVGKRSGWVTTKRT